MILDSNNSINKTIYNKEMLVKDIKAMGIEATDALLIHSSMKSVGQVEGGADTVIDAFLEVLSEGMFMLPTHTWAQMSAEYNLFDPESEDACTGIMPNLFYKREGVVRSLHPTHSMAVYGKASVKGEDGKKRIITANEYVQGEENVTTPCAANGCWGRLLDIDAKILLLGVNHVKNTFIHAIGEMFDVPERFTAEPVLFKIKMPDGSIKENYVYRHYNKNTAHISESFEKLAEGYLERGAAKYVKFGDADCILCSAKGLYEVTKDVLSHEINCFMDREQIPREWWAK